MNDLHTRFRSLDDLPVPDLWREAENRAQALQQTRPRPLSLALIALLLLLTLAISGAALIGSGVVKLPAFVETSSTVPEPTSETTLQPASGRIVFGRYDGLVGDYVVYLIDPDGTNENQLLPGAYECPRWSPDGKDISLGSGMFEDAGQPGGTFRAFPTFSGGVRYLPDPTLNLGCPVWSPDGTRLAYEGWDDTDPTRNGLYTLSISNGSDLQRLTSSPDGEHDLPGDYSADGSELFFVRMDPSREEAGQLMVVRTDGSAPRQLASDLFGIPSLSPDGQTLLAGRDGGLYLIAVDGSSATHITIVDSSSAIVGGSWSPDGDWIVFSVAGIGRGDWDLARVRPDGTGIFQITRNAADEEFADWAP